MSLSRKHDLYRHDVEFGITEDFDNTIQMLIQKDNLYRKEMNVHRWILMTAMLISFLLGVATGYVLFF